MGSKRLELLVRVLISTVSSFILQKPKGFFKLIDSFLDWVRKGYYLESVVIDHNSRLASPQGISTPIQAIPQVWIYWVTITPTLIQVLSQVGTISAVSSILTTSVMLADRPGISRIITGKTRRMVIS